MNGTHVSHSRSTDPRLPQGELPDGVSVVSDGVESQVQPDRKKKGSTKRKAKNAILPAPDKLAKYSTSNLSPRREIALSLNPVVKNIIANRTVFMDLVGDRQGPIKSNLPGNLFKFTNTWLKYNHLDWAANSQDFWSFLEQFLDGGCVESFSIDAVEQALIVCFANSRNDDYRRRVAIRQEMQSVRELRKVRDLQLKTKTAKILADLSLVSVDLVEKVWESK